jgi:glyoxylase-like metal-dependent hydrolase (beta-lactamase superfamily II)
MHSRATIDCDVLPKFTAAYLRIAGKECAFIETHTSVAVPKLLAELQAKGLSRESVRWIVVTHAHLDHAGGAGTLLAQCPNATLLAHPRAARHLIDPAKLIASATSVYGQERFAKLYGTITPIAETRVRVMEDGDTFALGDATLQVFHTAGHAKHHFIVHDPAMSTVFTGDTFGLVYPALQRGARFAIASTSPTDFDAAEARKSIDKVLSLGAKTACLTHYDALTDLDEVANQVRAWVDRSEAWLVRGQKSQDSMAAMHRWIANELKLAMEEESRRLGITFTKDDWDLLATDIDLNAQGIAFVADKSRKSG